MNAIIDGRSKSIAKEDSGLSQHQCLLLDMLILFDSACRIAHVDYMLAGGSALGALRHQGFIPWDDDVDIVMTRSAYLGFRDYLRGFIWDMDSLELIDPFTSRNYPVCIPRFVCHVDDNTDVILDIGLMENTYRATLPRTIHGFFSLSAGFALACCRDYNRKDELALLADYTTLKVRFRILLGRLISRVGSERIQKGALAIYGMCKDDTSKLVTFPTGRAHFFGELLERDCFFPTREVPFETIQAPVPHKAEVYLSNLYGDWQSIPRVEDRECHTLVGGLPVSYVSTKR